MSKDKDREKLAKDLADIHADPGYSWDRHIDRILEELQRIYTNSIRNLEVAFDYDIFRPSWFAETIVQKKPFILFLGPWSTGKSTFINYLMQANVLVTGPHPTTDKFTVILHGDELESVAGRVLVSDSAQPFRGLHQFGDAFVESMIGVLAPHPILRSVSFIDTPGVLESGGEVNKRRYDYIKVMRWFVERSDLVFVMFDPTKLDAGPELRKVFKQALRHQESKIRIVLNKADSVGAQELMRIYGSLFWTLSNLVSSTEPPRVYVSSFWDQPYKPFTNHELFSDEKADLIYELTDTIPRQSLDKRVSSVLRRANDVYLHSLLCATMAGRLPSFFGKDKAIRKEIASLPATFQDLAERNKLAVEDFGSPEEYDKFFSKVDMTKMLNVEKCNSKKWFKNIKDAINVELPGLLKPIKNAPIVDPRDRKHALMLQREYGQGLQRQLDGEQGLQGGLGEMATNLFRADTLPNASTYTNTARSNPAGMTPEQMQNQLLIQQMMHQMGGGAGSPLSPNMGGAGFSQNMGSPAGFGQQQQQEPQQQLMSPEQRMMMMMMMQQQQQQQQQPAGFGGGFGGY